jgi:MFS family permease
MWSRAGRPRTPLFTRGFTTLIAAQAGIGYAMGSFLLLPKWLVVELSAGPVEIGLVTAAYGTATVLCMFPMGAIVDRYGRKRFLAAGALTMLASSAGFALVREIGPVLYALRALQGVAFAMAFVAGSTLAVDEAPPQRLGQALGIFGLTMLSMNAVAPAVVESVVDRAGWPPAFLLAGAGALLCLCLLPFVRERPRAAATSDAPPPGLFQVVLRPRELRIGAVIALSGGACGTMFIYSQPFATELGFTHVRSFFVAYMSVAASARLFLGTLIDGAGRHRLATATLLLYALVVLSMVELPSLGLVPIGAVFGLAHGLFYPSLSALAVSDAPENERGKVMALVQGWFNVGFAGLVYALGFLARHHGYAAVFPAASAAAAAALAILALSPEGRGASGRVTPESS